MDYSTHIMCTLLPLIFDKSDVNKIPATESGPSLEQQVGDSMRLLRENLERLSQEFLNQPVTPEQTFALEHQVNEHLREAGRQFVQALYNHAEPAADACPKHVRFDLVFYTRLNRKTPQNAWTLFGQIRLRRSGYRPSDKSAEPTLFPLAMALGLVQGASPALAERAAGLMGDTGMTQQTVLRRLQEDHGVGWGVKKLRQVTAAVSAAMAEERQEVQTAKLLELLQQATDSKGSHKPLLSVGRDGITMGIRCRKGSVHEVATCGTVTVLDRRGRRLGTVYLAQVPEFGQQTMSQQLTQLLAEVLQRWQGPLPRLCYVTDSGDNETSYYDKVLAKMKHPRTGEKLEWQRVADYYHVSERVWKMGELLFGKGPQATAWVRKMQKWLLKPSGANRVLHSAAALKQQLGLGKRKVADFDKAYRYLRDRMCYMDYASYRRLGIPLGSGVTEAACKTVYTQRLKLSGMRWQKAGAQCILQLRVLRLSEVWDEAYLRVLRGIKQPKVWGQQPKPVSTARKAA